MVVVVTLSRWGDGKTVGRLIPIGRSVKRFHSCADPDNFAGAEASQGAAHPHFEGGQAPRNRKQMIRRLFEDKHLARLLNRLTARCIVSHSKSEYWRVRFLVEKKVGLRTHLNQISRQNV